MKKLLSAVLCIVMLTLTLVSCAEDPIGDYLDEYDYVPPVVEELSLNLYIITDDATTENAKETVRQRIAQYTGDKYHTTLNVKYVSAAEYSTVVTNVTAEGAENRADIVLVTSKAMFDELNGKNLLCDLTEFYGMNDFGKLNVQIASDLLQASMVLFDEAEETYKLYTVPNNHVIGKYTYLVFSKEIVRHYYVEQNVSTFKNIAQLSASNLWLNLIVAGKTPSDYIREVVCTEEEKAALLEANYTVLLETFEVEVDAPAEPDVPENEPATVEEGAQTTTKVTNYRYFAIDKAVATELNYTADDVTAEIEEYVDAAGFEAAALEQKNNIWYKLLLDGKNPADYITEVKGMYEDKAAIEAAGNYCNIVAYPTSDADCAFESAFAIVNGTKDPKRAMEMVYAINNDIELRNLLQYGVKDTNYTLEQVNLGTEDEPNYIYFVTRIDSGESVYYMNLRQTGNVFNAYYCEAIGWTPEVSANGTVQNKESNAN